MKSINEALKHRKCPLCNVYPTFLDIQAASLEEKVMILPIHHWTFLHIDRENLNIFKKIPYDLSLSDRKKCNEGSIIDKFKLRCQVCEKYESIYSITINLYMDVVTSLNLNMESIKIKEHCIKNKYEVEETEYLCNNSSVTIPLVSSDLQDYKDTLKRIQKLIVFL